MMITPTNTMSTQAQINSEDRVERETHDSVVNLPSPSVLCTQNTNCRRFNLASTKLGRNRMLLPALCLLAGIVLGTTSQDDEKDATQIDAQQDLDSPSSQESHGSRASAAAASDPQLDAGSTIIIAKHFLDSPDGQTFAAGLLNVEFLDGVEDNFQRGIDVCKNQLKKEIDVCKNQLKKTRKDHIKLNIRLEEDFDRAKREIEYIEGDAQRNIGCLKKCIQKNLDRMKPCDCSFGKWLASNNDSEADIEAQKAKGDCQKCGMTGKVHKTLKDLIHEKAFLNEATGYMISTVFNVSALLAIVRKYYAPAGAYTISEGLTKMPRGFTVPAFIIAAITATIGGYYETYTEMQEIAIEKYERTACGCCGPRTWCTAKNKTIAKVQFASTVIGALGLIPVAYWRTEYHGENQLHNLAAAGVFGSMIANAAAVVTLFKDSARKDLFNLSKLGSLVCASGLLTFGTFAIKKAFGLNGDVMTQEDCIPLYSAMECSQRIAKTYTGIGQAVQLTFSLAEHTACGLHIVLFLAINGALHPKAGCVSRHTNGCVQKVVKKTCGNSRCILGWLRCCRPVKEEQKMPEFELPGFEKLEAIQTSPSKKSTCCCAGLIPDRLKNWCQDMIKPASPDRTTDPDDGQSMFTGTAPARETVVDDRPSKGYPKDNVIFCPENHRTEWLNLDLSPGVFCIECDEPIIGEMAHCRKCDWDKCKRCINKDVGSPEKKSPKFSNARRLNELSGYRQIEHLIREEERARAN